DRRGSARSRRAAGRTSGRRASPRGRRGAGARSPDRSRGTAPPPASSRRDGRQEQHEGGPIRASPGVYLHAGDKRKQPSVKRFEAGRGIGMATIEIAKETWNSAVEVAPDFWVIATRHNPGGSKYNPQINNRCLIFRLKDASAGGMPVLLIANATDEV